MKKTLLFFYFTICIFICSFAQSGTWTWISGDSAANSAGVFGTLGMPSKYNHPPAIYDALEWKDKQGSFSIYGGTDTSGLNTDLWKFNPLTKEWTWMKGVRYIDLPPVYFVQVVSESVRWSGRFVKE